MTSPAKINLTVYQGSSFIEIFRWETSTKGYVEITDIQKSAPIIITAPGHTIPVGWRVLVTGVLGMKEINSTEEYRTVTSVTADTIQLNAINATQYSAYTSGGIVEYNMPPLLSNYSARMQIRPSLKSDTVIDELTTENGKLVIDDTYKTITIDVDAATTENYDFNTAVYSIELISSLDGMVSTFIEGLLILEKEVTR